MFVSKESERRLTASHSFGPESNTIANANTFRAKFIRDLKQEEKRHRTMVEGSKSYDFGAWHDCSNAMLPILLSRA